MKIQKKRERELAERQGSARKTIVQGTWLLLSIIVAFILFRYLDQSGTLTMRYLRTQLSLPAAVPEVVIMAIAILVFVIISQFFLTLGFFFASPQGRRKPGRGDLYSSNRDLDDRG
jgi:hypothetical protein